MSLLPLVFFLNGLSVPALELTTNDLSEPLQAAQQMAISDQNNCLQITEAVLQSRNPQKYGNYDTELSDWENA